VTALSSRNRQAGCPRARRAPERTTARAALERLPHRRATARIECAETWMMRLGRDGGGRPLPPPIATDIHSTGPATLLRAAALWHRVRRPSRPKRSPARVPSILRAPESRLAAVQPLVVGFEERPHPRARPHAAGLRPSPRASRSPARSSHS
jgi:hypothetical protein